MKIVHLKSENFKRLVAVEVTPQGNLVQITGRNGHGKTSLLDSIYAALAGKAAAPTMPIRKGQKKAKIRLDLGELIVSREFKAGDDGDYTTSLTVESKDGAQFRNPQTMLDSLLGELSFDPLAFARASAKEQLETLRSFVPGVDFEAIDRANQADFDRRRDINRSAKEKRAQAEGIVLPEDFKAESVDETALVAELEQAGQQNADIEKRKANRAQLAKDADALDREATTHESQAAEYEQRAQKAREAAARTKDEAAGIRKRLAEADALPDPIDTTLIRGKIANAQRANELVQKAEQRKALEDQAEKLEAQSEALTTAMEDRNESKAKSIAAANLPVPGLSFGSGEVQLAGVPFSQASDAEQLRASVAIAAALNPKLRVIRIRDGSLLDEDGMKLVAEMADAQDMQVWVEVVSDDKACGIHIVEGSVAETEEEQRAAG